MSATVLTADAARDAKIEIIANGKGSQAVHDAVVAMRANRRSGTANTKSKADVAYSGKKPYRQKGTGRARAGYMSSPIRRGGGVVFGPKPRDYSKKVPKNVKRLAFRKALSSRILDGDVSLIETFAVTELKTKAFIKLLAESTDALRKVLVISDEFSQDTYKSGRNVQAVHLTTASEVNTEHLLHFDKILITRGALSEIAERTASKAAAAAAFVPDQP